MASPPKYPGWSPLHEAISKKLLTEANIGTLKADLGTFFAVYCLPIQLAIFVGDEKQIQILNLDSSWC